MKTATNAIALLVSICLGACTSLGDITTGWLPTAAGNYTFTDSANWANGVVNGVFSSDLTLNANENIGFSSDWNGALKFYASATYATTKLYAKDAARTIYLNDDIEFACQGNEVKTRFLLGDPAASAPVLTFDLGGVPRTVSVDYATKWTAIPSLACRFVNGKLNIDTHNAANRKVCFAGQGGSVGDVELAAGTILTLGHASDTTGDLSGENAVHRANDLILCRSELDGGHKINADDIIDGALRVKDSEFGCSILQAKPQNNTKTYTLTAQSLVLDPGAVLLVRGSTLGQTLGANVANVKFATTPMLVGGNGAAGTTTISIVPQLLGATTDGGGVGQVWDQTFVTYDAQTGLRPLSAEEFANTIDSDTVNLKVASGANLQLATSATVNSLILESHGSASTITAAEGADNPVLTVSSGMILYGYIDNGTISVPVDFGNRKGVFLFGSGKNSRFNGTLHGTQGVTFCAPIAVTSSVGGGGMIVGSEAADSTYTGDTYIQDRVTVSTTGFLPHGERRGDVYVNGILLADNFTINGLYGKGTVNRATSGTKNMFVGDNDADGDFTGTFSVTDNSSTLTKIGTGTQRFGGTVTLASNGNFNVNVGKVVLDGTVTQGAVNVAAGAAIGGNGSIETTLTFADGAKFDVDVADDVASCLNVTGAVTGGPVTVNANVTGSKWRDAQRILRSGEEITATFVKGAGIGSLELRNGGTELWATPKVLSGFAIIIQ